MIKFSFDGRLEVDMADIMKLRTEIKDGIFNVYINKKDNKVYLKDAQTEEYIMLCDLTTHLHMIAEQVEDKIEYMCGCRNCIETMKAIIVRNFKPRESQCEQCYKFEECRKKQGR